MKFIITGGIVSKFASIEKKFYGVETSNYGVIEILDFEKKEIELVHKVVTDVNFRTEEKGRDIRFNSSTISGDKLYVSSPTQVFIYSIPEMKLIQTINSQYFNDVHHVTEYKNDLAVVSTGFDAVLRLSKKGELISVDNVLGKAAFHRFSETEDLRKHPSTKPHESHPNFTFELKGELWATRFHQKDAICLADPNKRFDIEIERPHDGHVYGDEIYFTTVDGHVVIFDVNTFERKRIINIGNLYDSKLPLGWCRSLCKVDDHIYVGFTRLRATKIEDNIRWLKSKIFDKDQPPMPTRIVKINLSSETIVDEFIIPDGHIDLVFSILPLEEN